MCPSPLASLTHVGHAYLARQVEHEHTHAHTRPAFLCSAPLPLAARACGRSTRPLRTLVGAPIPPSTPLLASATATTTVAAATITVVASAVPRLLMSPPIPHRLRQPPTPPLPHSPRKLHRTGRWYRCLLLWRRHLAPSHRTPQQQQPSRRQPAAAPAAPAVEVLGPCPYRRVGIAARRGMARDVGDKCGVLRLLVVERMCALLYILRETAWRTLYFGHASTRFE